MLYTFMYCRFLFVIVHYAKLWNKENRFLLLSSAATSATSFKNTLSLLQAICSLSYQHGKNLIHSFIFDTCVFFNMYPVNAWSFIWEDFSYLIPFNVWIQSFCKDQTTPSVPAFPDFGSALFMTRLISSICYTSDLWNTTTFRSRLVFIWSSRKNGWCFEASTCQKSRPI